MKQKILKEIKLTAGSILMSLFNNEVLKFKVYIYL